MGRGVLVMLSMDMDFVWWEDPSFPGKSHEDTREREKLFFLQSECAVCASWRERKSGKGGGGGGEEVDDENAEEASLKDLERWGMWTVGREGAVFGLTISLSADTGFERSGRGGSGGCSGEVLDQMSEVARPKTVVLTHHNTLEVILCTRVPSAMDLVRQHTNECASGVRRRSEDGAAMLNLFDRQLSIPRGGPSRLSVTLAL